MTVLSSTFGDAGNKEILTLWDLPLTQNCREPQIEVMPNGIHTLTLQNPQESEWLGVYSPKEIITELELHD